MPRFSHGRIAALVIALLCAHAGAATAQQEHHPGMMDGPLGVSHVRMGSGTSWMPDSSPMHANHKMWGDWTVMLHGAAFGQYDDQGSSRGDKQLGVVDWEMLMAMRKIGTGMLHLHGMASLEPATIGAKGYPLLLQTGESYQGQPLHDRQHPHDAFMELAAMFQQPVASNLALELYAGPAGEPALGPVAFMHRPSAQNDPLAPLGHHWQDATHISFGVATAGLYSRAWKLEGSWFNGREPDENRWNFDLRRFDSYSGRLTVNPSGRVSLAAWYGYLPSPEALHPEEQVHRYGTSFMYGGRGIAGGAWGSTLLWGANRVAGRVANSMLAETNLEIGQKNAVFGRAEYVQKTAEELVAGGLPPDQRFDVKSLVAGYVREIGSVRGGTIGLGGRASVNFIPGTLQPLYGTRTPAGIDVYIRIRPKRMANESMAGMTMPRDTMRAMPGMKMPADTMRAMPGMKMPADTMRAMPGMKMPADTMRAMPGMRTPDKKMPGMAMPSTPTPGMPMSGMQPSPKKSPAAGQAMPMQMPKDSSHVRKATSAAPHKAPRKASAKSRKKATSTGHTMPGMTKMPGMKMPADSARPRKP